MALAKCRECGHEVSNICEKCPNCGCDSPSMSHEQYRKTDNIMGVISIIMLILCVFGAICWVIAMTM